ncbi:MAG TPA: endolytic transglycosylase MltG [Bacteroidota bacterium]|jgi:UPF0755 protein|nr:endolytic transglycosylase MltG [Bacteroidota bacterium]
MLRKILVVIGILLLLAIAFVYEALWAPNKFDGDRFVIVSKGDSYAKVAAAIEKAGIIRSRLLFDAAGRILDLTTKMQIGKYRFKSGMSNTEVLEDLRYGKTVEMILVTIPEGFTAVRHARIFARQLGIDSARYMSLVNDSAFTRSLGVDANNLQGYLMPNTYKMYWQTDETDIIRDQVEQLLSMFSDTLRARADTLGLSIREVITLASIVEKETAIDSERTLIAGVYYNRLKKKMRLQADPTVQYIIGGGPRRLRFSDLHLESDYNTYLHTGLPPGPVSNPGKASILAAVHPAKSKFLFFVANGFGGHVFSRTFKEHQKAIRQFHKIRAEQQALKQESESR